MDKLKYWSFLFFFFLFCSCRQHALDPAEWNNPYPNRKDNKVFHLIAHNKYLLDSTTSLSFGLMQYNEKENILVAFNSYDNSFVIFDYNTSAIVRKIRLSKDPAKGVGTFVNPFSYSFYFVNDDSILLFNKSKGKLFLVDGMATVKKVYSVVPHDKSFTQPVGTFGEL